MKQDKLFLVSGIIIVTLIVGGALILGVSSKTTHHISLAKAAQDTANYFNKNLLKGRNLTAVVTKKEQDPESGLYKIRLDINGQKLAVYVSPNGNFIFPQAINIHPKITAIPKTKKPDVDLFVMAFCPFGNQAEDSMIPALKLLGNKVNFHLHYIVSKSGNTWASLHGPQELHEDVREICVENSNPDKFLTFVKGINDGCTPKNADQCWVKVAKNSGLDTAKITKCQTDQTSTLLNQENKLTEKEYPIDNPAKYQGKEKSTITGSPTLVINGVISSGGRTSQDYLKAICTAFSNPPQECNSQIGNKASSPAGSCN